MSEFEKDKLEALSPILLEAGAALMDCQTFEYGVTLLLFHLTRMGFHDMSPDSVVEILEDKNKRTAGQIVNLLRKKIKLSDGLEEAISDALNARNYIIHRFLTDNTEKFLNETTREEVRRDLRNLRRKVRVADGMLRPFINSFSEALDGIKIEDIEKEAKSAFAKK
jgi:hypothetical protein